MVFPSARPGLAHGVRLLTSADPHRAIPLAEGTRTFLNVAPALAPCSCRAGPRTSTWRWPAADAI